MKDDKKTVEEALNDIFGGDFIEVDSKSKKTEETKKEEKLDNKKESIFDEVKFEDDTSLSTPMNEDLVYEEEIEKENTSSVKIKKNDEIKENKDDNDINDKLTNKNEDNKQIIENKTKKKNKIILFFIIGIIIGITIIILFISYSFNKQRVVECVLEIKDDGYKVNDKYQIAYQNNKILYLNSDYNYKALNDEYKKQIEFVKQDKIPVMINSNSMSGFTYIYESGEDYFNIKGSLDFTKFNYNEINKVNQKSNPISYFTIKKGINIEQLTKKLEKDGYKCGKK